jgi:hypothetical protein
MIATATATSNKVADIFAWQADGMLEPNYTSSNTPATSL